MSTILKMFCLLPDTGTNVPRSKCNVGESVCCLVVWAMFVSPICVTQWGLLEHSVCLAKVKLYFLTSREQPMYVNLLGLLWWHSCVLVGLDLSNLDVACLIQKPFSLSVMFCGGDGKRDEWHFGKFDFYPPTVSYSVWLSFGILFPKQFSCCCCKGSCSHQYSKLM